MASVHFEAYREELQSLMQQIRQSDDNDDDVASLFRQCRDVLKQLSMEARSSGDDVKQDLLESVKVAKQQLDILQQDYDRKRLLGADNNEGQPSDASRQQLQNTLRSNETMVQQQNESLERARRTMAETEAIGLEVTHELNQNRAKLESSQGRVAELSSMTGQADQLLKSMNKPWWRKGLGL